VSHHRIGMIVPSSNVTVETEVPALLARHASATFSFHSSRMRMHTVSPEELVAMNAQRGRCVDELSDAGVDALLYACLVAVMAQGTGEHRRVEAEVAAQLAERGLPAGLVSSAGALVEALAAASYRRVALVMPYLRPLAEQVVAYLEAEGVEVVDWVALEVGDNTEVGCIPGDRDFLAALRTLTETAGAILIWAVDASTSGFNIHTAGVILLVIGIVGLVVSIVFWSAWHALVLPLSVMPRTANTVTVARMPRITMTISNSTSVKPLSCFFSSTSMWFSMMSVPPAFRVSIHV